MNVIWSRTTRADLEHIRSYIAEREPRAAAKVAQTILAAVEQLQSFPSTGRVGRVPGTRELVLSGTPYIVPYRVTERGLEIIAVIHGRRRWPDAF
jgi:toxin ParE1/3/4